jgi:Carboxypeptidase regulatory-like domain
MTNRLPVAPWCFWLLLFPIGLEAQVAISGRVIDETGAAVSGARVELRDAAGATAGIVSSDPAGKFSLSLGTPFGPGPYDIRVERQGFYMYRGQRQEFADGPNELTVTLNHLQEFSDRIDVPASSPAIDPQQPAERAELDNAEIETIPYPASRDYRNALPLMDGVVEDNAGRAHFNGGATNQTNYNLDGFNISDPVTGNLETRVNLDSIQSMDLESSRYSAGNGRGSAGVLDLKTKMGDDRMRFGATNFVPGFSTEGGLHLSKWSPQLEFSGPLARGRAWFHEGLDNFYSDDYVHGLPGGQNYTTGLTSSSLSRFQVNLTPTNILTGSFLANRANVSRNGLSFLNPAETTVNDHQMLYMSSLRDQVYFGAGSLLDVGFADTRGMLRDTPQGNALFEITPDGSRGNYFVNLDRHFYRQQWQANFSRSALNLFGAHQLQFGIDFERESFHQTVLRHDYEVLRDDNSVARYVRFFGSPFQGRKNFEAAEFIQDRWTPREGVLVEAGLRAEWNEIVRALELAPRLSATWAPGFLRDTKFAAGWGLYYDAITLQWLASQQDQKSLATFFSPGAVPLGPVLTSFASNDHKLDTPYYHSASFSVEHKLPWNIFGKAAYIHRSGGHGFTFLPSDPHAALAQTGNVTYLLGNYRRDRYDAFEMSVRHTFAGRYEWFAGYTRSSARSNAAVDYSLENPIFAVESPGPYLWDAPNRFHMWGWAPLPNRLLPHALQFVTHETSAVYLVEYRTGFPFSIVDQNAFLVGAPNSARLPDYFNINLDFERKFRALHYQWAWRFGFNNITNNGNPNSVNNVLGSPQFLTYARGQARAFNVRLKLLGRK